MDGATRLAAVACAAILMTSPVHAEREATLETCQKIRDRIEHYTNLRRAGGTASRMDRWKRLRREQEDAFERRDCRRYGSELR